MLTNVRETFSQKAIFCTLALSLLVVPPGSAGAAEWQPTRAVELVVAANAGGGADAAARAVQRIIQDQKLASTNMTVVNKPGGGGAVAFNYLNQHAGDGHFLTLGTAPLITSHIIGQSQFTYTDFTPIAMLYNEYVVISVRAESEFKSAGDLVARFRQDAAALNVGVASSRGNTNHIAIAMLVKVAGGDVRKMKAVIFGSGGKAVSALLGGHVDVVPSNASLVQPHVLAGRIRIVGVAAPERLGGALAQVPTLKEQGLDVVSSNWRAILGPRGLGAGEVAYWEAVFARLVKTEEFKSDLDKRLWVANFLGGRQAAAALEKEYGELKGVLTDLGLAK